MTGVVAQMRSVSSEQYTRVAVNDRYQHRGQSNGPHSSNGGEHCEVGVLLVVLGDHFGSANPTGTSDVSLSCARAKNSAPRITALRALRQLSNVPLQSQRHKACRP